MTDSKTGTVDPAIQEAIEACGQEVANAQATYKLLMRNALGSLHELGGIERITKDGVESLTNGKKTWSADDRATTEYAIQDVIDVKLGELEQNCISNSGAVKHFTTR